MKNTCNLLWNYIFLIKNINFQWIILRKTDFFEINRYLLLKIRILNALYNEH